MSNARIFINSNHQNKNRKSGKKVRKENIVESIQDSKYVIWRSTHGMRETEKMIIIVIVFEHWTFTELFMLYDALE